MAKYNKTPPKDTPPLYNAGADPTERGVGGAESFPCLYSNNSTEDSFQSGEFKSNRLSTSQKKSAISLSWNVQYMAQKHGLKNLGFLTLTFADNVTYMKEAQRRFNSLNTHVISKRYNGSIAVKERMKSGRIHFHLLVALPMDIRTGFDFEDIERGNYSSASKSLRSEWAFWRKTAKKYGFGRTELLPIRSTSEGIARYVGKYISKNVQQRPDEDKGTRLVNYGGDSKIATTRFSALTEGSRNWRHKASLFAKDIARIRGLPPINQANISIHLGKRWAYNWREFILDNYPDLPSLE